MNRATSRRNQRIKASLGQSEEKVKNRWLKTCSWALGKTEYELNSILFHSKQPVFDYPGAIALPVRLSRTDLDAVKSALKEIVSSKPKPINPEDDCC